MSNQTTSDNLQTTVFVDPQLLIRNGKIEKIEKDGHLLTPCVWKWADSFREGLARVAAEYGLGGYIDTMGNVVIPCIWKTAENFSEGLALVQNKNNAFFFIDKSGNIVISCGSDINPYLQCGGFHEGLAVVRDTQSDRYGFMDKSGHIAIPCQWEDACYFLEGLATVWNNEKSGCIDKTGRLVIPCKFNEGPYFHEGLAFVFSDDEDEEYVIDKTGHKVFDMVYQHYDSRFQEGLVSSDDNGFVDQNGELVIEDKWSPCGMGFSEGVAPTEEGYIDHSGRVVIPNRWDECFEFHEGLAIVTNSGKCGYIDHGGHEAVPCIWDEAYSFSNGLAKVKLDGKCYFIDKQGKVLCKVVK